MITQAEIVELVNLYHLAQTALCQRPFTRGGGVMAVQVRATGRYDRMCWAVNTFCRERPGASKIRAYKALSEALS